MKFARIPIASHGLRRHKLQFPFLGTCNFMQVFPVYYKPLFKGERASVQAPLYARLNPVVNPAFATGRFEFKGFFVPYKYVYRPWYEFDSGVEFYPHNGVANDAFIPTSAPWTTLEAIAEAFINVPHGQTEGSFVIQVNDVNDSDITFDHFNGTGYDQWYFAVKPLGARVLSILNALGYSPIWQNSNGTRQATRVNILNILSYIKIYLQYYFPSQYVGTSDYQFLENCIDLEENDYSQNAKTAWLVTALGACSLGVYDSNLFDSAFDSPVAPSTSSNIPSLTVTDNTASVSGGSDLVTNNPSSSAFNNENGTPILQNSQSTQLRYLSQYVLDALQSVNNFVKRHQLAGGRLLDNLLARRGITVNHDSIMKPYWLGNKSVEINIDDVVNTTDQFLGELAGKGTASSGNSPLKFDCTAEDDGVFMIVCFVRPDSDLPVGTDIYNMYVDQLDFYHPEFDKLGVEAVPSLCLNNTMRIGTQLPSVGHVFGFLNRYAGYLQERTRLTGDFKLYTRGEFSLRGFNTFRLLNTNPASHGLNFVHGDDSIQYQRLFYSSGVDNLQLFIRFFETSYLQKLPLGESFDWDDDEMNKKVNIAVTGSQSV